MAVSPDPHLAPAPQRSTGRHRLPLISVLLACVFPVCFLAVVFSGGLVLQEPLAWELLALWGAVILGALVTGHLALLHAPRDPPAQAGRGLAITALVLGYLSLSYVVWIFGSFLSGGLGD